MAVTEPLLEPHSNEERLWLPRMNLGGSVRLNPLGIAIVLCILVLLVFFNSGGSSRSSPSGNVVNLKEVGGHDISQTAASLILLTFQLLSVAIAAAEKGGERVVAIR